MKQLTWLAAERRLCAEGDSEEEHSPTSPGSQEEEEEEEEEGPKGEEAGEGRSSKEGQDEEMPAGEGMRRGGGRCPGRGRGQSRFISPPLRLLIPCSQLFLSVCRAEPTSARPEEESPGASQQRRGETAAAVR